MSIVIFLIILLVVVLAHEFGHFITAKKSGIRVDEFAFGFPPRLFSIKRGETNYSFNAVPFGGYVKIFGENPDENSISGPDSKRSMVNKKKRVQALVLVAGVAFNILLAWMLFSIGFMAGLPTSTSSTPNSAIKNSALVITSIEAGAPAEKAGLIAGDKVVALENLSTGEKRENPDIEMLKSFISTNGTNEIVLDVLRRKDNLAIKITPEKVGASATPTIGVSLDMIGTLKLPIHKAIWEGLKLTASLTWGTTKAFGNLIGGAFNGTANLKDVTGPVGIVGVIGDAAKFGISYLLSFTALISINLAIINLAPFPALDGGRLLFLLIEKIKGSPIKPKIFNMANAIGFSLLIILMIVITYHDIIKLI